MKGDSNSDRWSAIVWSDSSVVTNLERVEDGGDIDGAGGCDVEQ